MSATTKFVKLQRQPGVASGCSTAFPILQRKHGNPPFGMGVTEFSAGVLEINLNYDEALYLLEGDLEIATGSERHVLAPGEALWMPRGETVQYIVRKTCRVLYVISPASPNT